jgi:hypothetical protein
MRPIRSRPWSSGFEPASRKQVSASTFTWLIKNFRAESWWENVVFQSKKAFWFFCQGPKPKNFKFRPSIILNSWFKMVRCVFSSSKKEVAFHFHFFLRSFSLLRFPVGWSMGLEQSCCIKEWSLTKNDSSGITFSYLFIKRKRRRHAHTTLSSSMKTKEKKQTRSSYVCPELMWSATWFFPRTRNFWFYFQGGRAKYELVYITFRKRIYRYA